MIQHDILIVGGGLAGLPAAIGLCERWDVAVLSKVHPSVRIPAPPREGSTPRSETRPRAATIRRKARLRHDQGRRLSGRSGRGGQDVRPGPGSDPRVGTLGRARSAGFRTARSPSGPSAAQAFPAPAMRADKTGHVLLHTLYEQALRRGIKIYNEHAVTRLAVQDGRCHGVIAYDLRRGRFESFASKFCVLATGGYGRLYRNSTNA